MFWSFYKMGCKSTPPNAPALGRLSRWGCSGPRLEKMGHTFLFSLSGFGVPGAAGGWLEGELYCQPLWALVEDGLQTAGVALATEVLPSCPERGEGPSCGPRGPGPLTHCPISWARLQSQADLDVTVMPRKPQRNPCFVLRTGTGAAQLQKGRPCRKTGTGLPALLII
jgi:hypothetical protein